MGLFDALTGIIRRTKIEVVPDHLWITTDARFARLAKEAEGFLRSQMVAILLVASSTRWLFVLSN